LLTLITQSETLPKEILPEDFDDQKLRTIFELIEKNSPQEKITIEKVAKEIPSELEDLFNEISLSKSEDILLEQEEIANEIKTCALRLKELNLRTRLKEASLAIKQAELREENEKIETLTKQFDTLSNQLSKIEKTKED
jgi:replicative DNA helicase